MRYMTELEERLTGGVVAEKAAQVAQLSAALTMTSQDLAIARRVAKWLKLAATTGVGGGVVMMALSMARQCGQYEAAEATRDVVVDAAAQTVEAKAAELTARHEETREIAIESTKRIDQLESKLDQVLELLTKPTHVSVPAEPKRPKSGHKPAEK